MSKVFIEESTLTAIGDSIRNKTGKQALISPLNMPTEIESIKGGNIIKTVSGICPVTLENCAEGNLLDYKIYGAEGRVGNQTKNLFDISRWSGSGVGNQTISKTTLPNYPGIEFMRYIDGGNSITFTADFKENTQYTFTVLMHRAQDATAQHTNMQIYYTDGTYSNCVIPRDALKSFTSTSGKTVKNIKSSSSFSAATYFDLSVTQIEEGAKATTFEPSGYVIPLKMNDTIHKAYLGMNQLGIDDYLDYENRCIVKSDGTKTHIDLPEIPLIEGTNTFDVETAVKPSNVSLTYVKSVEFNTMKTVEGILPLTVEGVGQKLEDYKIYGAEGGVGNKTKNLCKGEFNKQYAEFDEPIPAGTKFSISASSKGYDASDATKKLRVRFFASDNSQVTNIYPTLDSTGTKIKFDNLSYAKDITSYWLTNLKAEEVQIEIGSVHTDYEPYGYKIPIKVNDNVSKIYTKELLGVDDYIDFENRVLVKDGVSSYLELPEIYLQNGRNVISVDTTVKPSKMSVSYIDNDGGYDAGYKKGYDAMKLAIDMSDVDYQFNETVTSYPSNWYRINLNFTDANGKSYTQMAPYTSSGKININYWPTSGSSVIVYNAANSPAWTDESYRTIHIKDGNMTGDIKTFSWLMNNGVFNPTA